MHFSIQVDPTLFELVMKPVVPYFFVVLAQSVDPRTIVCSRILFQFFSMEQYNRGLCMLCFDPTFPSFHLKECQYNEFVEASGGHNNVCYNKICNTCSTRFRFQGREFRVCRFHMGEIFPNFVFDHGWTPIEMYADPMPYHVPEPEMTPSSVIWELRTEVTHLQKRLRQIREIEEAQSESNSVLRREVRRLVQEVDNYKEETEDLLRQIDHLRSEIASIEEVRDEARTDLDYAQAKIRWYEEQMQSIREMTEEECPAIPP